MKEMNLTSNNDINQTVKSQIKSNLSNTWKSKHTLLRHRRHKQGCKFASYLQDARMPMRDSANEGNRGWQARDRAMYQRQRRATSVHTDAQWGWMLRSWSRPFNLSLPPSPALPAAVSNKSPPFPRWQALWLARESQHCIAGKKHCRLLISAS